MNAIEMLIKSVSLAALDSTLSPGVLQPWVYEIKAHGKFSQAEVTYLPFSPPPVFWDYKCRKCRWWVEGGQCEVVEGEISPGGWCVIWLPHVDYKPLTWPQELLRGDW